MFAICLHVAEYKNGASRSFRHFFSHVKNKYLLAETKSW